LTRQWVSRRLATYVEVMLIRLADAIHVVIHHLIRITFLKPVVSRSFFSQGIPWLPCVIA